MRKYVGIKRIASLNESARLDNKRYTKLSMKTSVLENLLLKYDGKINKLGEAFGIKGFHRIDKNNDISEIYIQKKNASHQSIVSFAKESSASITEIYGIVQFNGDEPEANGVYNDTPTFTYADQRSYQDDDETGIKPVNTKKDDNEDNVERDMITDEIPDEKKKEISKINKSNSDDEESEEEETEEEEITSDSEEENKEEAESEEDEEDSDENIEGEDSDSNKETEETSDKGEDSDSNEETEETSDEEDSEIDNGESSDDFDDEENNEEDEEVADDDFGDDSSEEDEIDDDFDDDDFEGEEEENSSDSEETDENDEENNDNEVEEIEKDSDEEEEEPEKTEESKKPKKKKFGNRLLSSTEVGAVSGFQVGAVDRILPVSDHLPYPPAGSVPRVMNPRRRKIHVIDGRVK